MATSHNRRRVRRTASRVWCVSCGMRNDAPSWMLGNVHCGSVATGSVWFKNVLTLALNAFTNVADRAMVQEPRTALYLFNAV